MDTTIRNLDDDAYRELKARAAREGRTMGQMVNEAIRAYLGRPETSGEEGSLLDLIPEEWPEGNEHVSEEIDGIVYGVREEDR
ncbi:MAG: ribbon-helix-helix protein, CopG family [bacterium]